MLAKSLLGLKGELKGDYFALAGSQSYVPKPGGMTYAEETQMRDEGLLFDSPPDSTLLLSSGRGRDWPDARGVLRPFNEDLNILHLILKSRGCQNPE